MPFVLKQFEIGPMQNFGYMIADEKTKQAIIVDPAWAPEKLRKLPEEEGFKLVGLAITHAHYDHTNAIEDILSKVDVPVYANKNEIAYSKSGVGIVGSLGSTAKALESEETVMLGETPLKFIHVPGHTPGSQLIQVGESLLTGDTLFIGGCGRSDLPGGDAATLFKSLQKISKMPDNLTLLTGHDYGEVRSRNLRDELKYNPYLRMSSEDQFTSAVS